MQLLRPTRLGAAKAIAAMMHKIMRAQQLQHLGPCKVPSQQMHQGLVGLTHCLPDMLPGRPPDQLAMAPL